MLASGTRTVATSGLLGVGNSDHASDPAHHEHPTRETTRRRLPVPTRYPLALHRLHHVHAFPARPLTALPISSLLILIPDPPCLPPPHLRPCRYMPGLPCHFYWQVEETPILQQPQSTPTDQQADRDAALRMRGPVGRGADRARASRDPVRISAECGPSCLGRARARRPSICSVVPVVCRSGWSAQVRRPRRCRHR